MDEKLSPHGGGFFIGLKNFNKNLHLEKNTIRFVPIYTILYLISLSINTYPNPPIFLNGRTHTMKK